ncbi:MAG TPA: hypothetical protein DEH78_23275, partial [Solibacterales bacterium]|nr:hypothetical protein [Bryobacterales bacterium]
MQISSNSGRSTKDGQFRICNLAPGTYSIAALGGTPASRFSFATASFTIIDRDIENFTLSPAPLVSVQGRVAWTGEPPKDLPWGGVLLQLRPVHGGLSEVTRYVPLPASGSFRWREEAQAPEELAPGEYGVRVLGLPRGAYLKDIAYGAASVVVSSWRPQEGLSGTDLVVTFAADGGSVRVTASDRHGKPVPKAGVALIPHR